MIPKPKLITDLIIDGGSGSLVATSSSGHGVFSVTQNMTEFGNKPDVPLEALDASVTLNIDGASSSASIRLPQGTNIDGRAYIRMYTVQGFAGIFRTRSPQIGFGGSSTTLQLEHAINELGDYIIAEKIVPKKKMSLKSALQKIFKYYNEKSNLWTLGSQIDNPADTDIEDWEADCILEADYDNCLDVLESVMEQYPSMMLEFDFSSRPWKLNVRNRSRVVTAEGRLARNVKSATVTRDDSELFTRVYMDGYKNNDGKYGSYTSKSAKDKYGLIETVITGSGDVTAEVAQRTVKSYMRNHKNPKISVTIDAIELCNITGETFDRFSIGKLCRLALPDYGETVSETITSLAFPSIYKSPNSCTVTLNSEEDRAIKYIKKASKTASRASRSASASAKTLSTTAIVDATLVGNTLTLIKGNGDKINFSKAVTLKDGWSVGTYTVKAYQENSGKETQVGDPISTSLNGIWLQDGKTPSASGKFLTAPLKVTYRNSKNTYSNTGYNQSLTLDATGVWNNGWDDAAGKVKLPSSGTSNIITVKYPLKVNLFTRKQETINYYLTKTLTPGTTGYALVMKDALTTIARLDISDWYTTGRTAGWETARTFVVPPEASTASATMSVGIPASTWNQASSYAFTVSTDDSYGYIKNALNQVVARCNNGAYGNGWSAAREFVDPPSASTSNDYFDFGVPSVTVNAGSSYRYKVSVDNDYAYIKNAANSTVARCSNSAYNNGKKAATVSLSHGTVTADSNYQKYVTYKATNDSNTNNKAEKTLYLVKSGNKAQLRETSASGTLVMEINTN